MTKELGDGGIVTHTYNQAEYLTGIINAKADGALVSRFTYTYDPVGNRTNQLALDGATTDWSYDRTYQLVNELRTGGGATVLGWNQFTLAQWDAFTLDEWDTFELNEQTGTVSFNTTYTYDPVGNRTLKEDSGALTTSTYDVANRLLTEEDASGTTTYTYDADGNRTRKETPSTLTDYGWDEDNLLTSAEPMEGAVSFTYNADGQRVRKETPTETKKYLFDFRKLLAETDDVDNPLVEFTQTLDEYGDLISEFDDSDATTSYHTYDAQWSTEALLDSADNVTDRYQYTAFGLQTHSEGTNDTPLTFVGKQNYYRDNEIDLYLLGLGGQPLTHQPTNQKAGRQYDPATGQPTSPDPLGIDTDPQGNLYVCSGNNPVNDIDPSGQQDVANELRSFAVGLVDGWLKGTMGPNEFIAQASQDQDPQKAEAKRKAVCRQMYLKGMNRSSHPHNDIYRILCRGESLPATQPPAVQGAPLPPSQQPSTPTTSPGPNFQPTPVEIEPTPGGFEDTNDLGGRPVGIQETSDAERTARIRRAISAAGERFRKRIAEIDDEERREQQCAGCIDARGSAKDCASAVTDAIQALQSATISDILAVPAKVRLAQELCEKAERQQAEAESREERRLERAVERRTLEHFQTVGQYLDAIFASGRPTASGDSRSWQNQLLTGKIDVGEMQLAVAEEIADFVDPTTVPRAIGNAVITLQDDPYNVDAWAVIGLTLAGGLAAALSGRRRRRGKRKCDNGDTPGTTPGGNAPKGGTNIRNAHLAGKTHPKTGIPFDKDGFPDFSSVTKTEVKITQTGSRPGDFRAANQAAGFSETPSGFTWHHHQDGTTMQLVPSDIHRQTGHTGGFSLGGN